jgi:hypothetical protein
MSSIYFLKSDNVFIRSFKKLGLKNLFQSNFTFSFWNLIAIYGRFKPQQRPMNEHPSLLL